MIPPPAKVLKFPEDAQQNSVSTFGQDEHLRHPRFAFGLTQPEIAAMFNFTDSKKLKEVLIAVLNNPSRIGPGDL